MAPLVLTVATPAQAVVHGITACLNEGEPVAARGIPALEVRYSTLEIERPWQIPFTIPGRKERQEIGALEALCLVGQTSNADAFTSRVGKFKQFVEHGVFWGAYGTRLAGQLGMVVDSLVLDPDSRQAVATIFEGHRDLYRVTADTPCTIAIQWMIRDEGLEQRVVMRSNDAWLGLTYDVVQFAALHAAIACALGAPMGAYVHQAGSLHLYQDDVEAAQSIEPPDEPAIYYEPMWHGTDLGQIGRWAREVLADKKPQPHTQFEDWLVAVLQ